MNIEDQDLLENARAARLLADLPEPPPVTVARVRARIDATSRAPAPRERGLRLVAISATAVLAAASALLVVRHAMEPVPVEPVPVAAALSAEGTYAIDTTISGVALSYEGMGSVEGTSDAPRVQWERGTLNVEVTPGRGIRLAVETREAEVRVVGTGFTVHRDALGTQVDVRHGKVEVDCGQEVTRVLTAGDAVTCLPTSAAGLLGRARALDEQGALPADVLAALDAGLAASGGAQPAVVDELGARRVRALYDMGRSAEALTTAHELLQRGGGLRRADVVSIAAAAARNLGGCATAAPWLVELSPDGCGK